MGVDIVSLIKEDLSDKRRVFPCGMTPLGGCDFTRPDPEHVRDGKVFMRSTNLDHYGSWLTIEEYLELRKCPYRSVGIWSFVPENDPAAHYIAGAHSSPDYYGKRVYELENKVEVISTLVEALKTARHQVNLFARPDDAIAQTVLRVIDAALAKVVSP